MMFSRNAVDIIVIKKKSLRSGAQPWVLHTITRRSLCFGFFWVISSGGLRLHDSQGRVPSAAFPSADPLLLKPVCGPHTVPDLTAPPRHASPSQPVGHHFCQTPVLVPSFTSLSAALLTCRAVLCCRLLPAPLTQGKVWMPAQGD